MCGEITENSAIFATKIVTMKTREVPKFVLKLDFMLGIVAFIVVFSVLFMIIYAPFSITHWFDIFDKQQLSITVTFYITSIMMMVLSKIMMMWAQNKITITIPVYALWLIGEIVAIALLYTAFTGLFVPGETGHSILRIAFRAFCCVTAILTIPYIISFLYAAYKAKVEENEMMRYRSRISSDGADTSRLINLYDGNGTVKMTVDIDSLYYMESQDNYVKICYENEDALHYYMLRCRTKVLEKSLEGTPMRRCHRSYIINTTKIKLLRPDKSNSVAILKHPGVKPVPVSKRYYDQLVGTIAANPCPELPESAESN